VKSFVYFVTERPIWSILQEPFIRISKALRPIQKQLCSLRNALLVATALVAPALAMSAMDPADRPSRPQPAPQPVATVIEKPIAFHSAVILAQDASRRPAATPQPNAAGGASSQNTPTQTAAPVATPAPSPTESAAPDSSATSASTDTTNTTPPPVVNEVPAGVVQLEGSLVSAGAKEIRGSRRVGPTDKVKLTFKDTKIEDTIPFIVETTGKAVLIRLQQVAAIKITMVMDTEVTRQDALDLLFQAFRLNQVGVVETEKIVMIDMLSDMNKLQPVTVLGPEIDVAALAEDGTICIKIFKIENTKAQNVFDQLQSTNPPDYIQFSLDSNSNQIILEGDIGYAKRVQRMISLLDVPAYLEVRTETFKLKYADATQISTLIQDLFAAKTVGGGGAAAATQPGQQGQPQRPGQPAQARRAGGGSGGEGLIPGTSEQLVVTVLPTMNSLTIRAEPEILVEIRRLITTAWDVPITKDGQPFRLYDLKYTDPIKVKDLLQALLESGGGGSSATRRPFSAAGGAAGGANRNTGASRAGGGGGGDSGADVAVSNVFRIEAYPDSGRLLVVTKTPDNFVWLDKLIKDIDQPLKAGLPISVELKHASAVEVAEILNALLAEAGSGSGIKAPNEGLTGIDFQGAAAGDAGGTGQTTNIGSNGSAGGTATEIKFPWQTARGAGDTATEVSALVGKTRVVPNAGQNSVLVLATPEIQQAMMDIIEKLDKPGRQVMISAVLAEVVLGDQFAFGLKFGKRGDIQPLTGANAIVINGQGTTPIYEGTRTGDFIGDLTSSVLSFGVDASVILQALEEQTQVRILQQPRVFTSDNQEAKFFDGADVPFQTGSTTGGTTGGGTTSSFDQIAVGIGLNVRPRITKDLNVAMQIEILLSNVDTTTRTVVTPGNNPTIQRRQTNTSVVIKNGQTIVISGIRKETENKVKTKVPVLGDVPVLDWVFSSTEKVSAATELVLFVTPIVVENPDGNDTNYNVQEIERLRALQKPMDSKTEEMLKLLDDKKGTTEPAMANPTDEPLETIMTPSVVRSPAAAPVSSGTTSTPAATSTAPAPSNSGANAATSPPPKG
jgi:general secretion pathway protein D